MVKLDPQTVSKEYLIENAQRLLIKIPPEDQYYFIEIIEELKTLHAGTSTHAKLPKPDDRTIQRLEFLINTNNKYSSAEEMNRAAKMANERMIKNFQAAGAALAFVLLRYYLMDVALFTELALPSLFILGIVSVFFNHGAELPLDVYVFVLIVFFDNFFSVLCLLGALNSLVKSALFIQ